MANTYTKIYFHIIFAVKGRESMLPLTEQMRVQQYMATVLRTLGQTPIAIGGTENHVHLLVEYRPNIGLADMVREVKTSSTKFINCNRLIPYKFSWQRGYGCFSYSPSQIDVVKRYVLNQLEHHKRVSFREEITTTYAKFGIDYDEKYIFEDE